jgi:hypothetical protein
LSDEQESRSKRTFEEQIALDLERQHREVDPCENAETTPPDDEVIETCCVWVTECYPPSQVAVLVSGLKKLGWDKRRPIDIYGYEVIDWLERQREYPYAGASLNLGHIVREGEGNRFGGIDERFAQLPEGVDYAYAYIRNLLPSLTILTVQFVLDDHGAKSLEETARGTFATHVEERGGVRHFVSVVNQKAEAIQSERARLRASCCGWFREHVPGVFSEDEEEKTFPTCEFLTLDKARPFERPPNSRSNNYLRPLHMDNEADAWESLTITGTRLGLPSAFDEDQLALVLTAKRSELPSEEHFSPYGGKGRSGISNWLREEAEELMQMWTLNAMMRSYERRLTNLRDGAGEIDVRDPEGAAEKIQHAQSRLVRLSTDLLPLTSELSDLCEKEYFPRLVPEFESLIEYSPYGRLKLGEVYRDDLSRRAARARELEGELRDMVMTGGSVIGAISQERASQANLHLQGRLTFLTWVLVVLTGVLVVIGIATVWVTLRVAS